IAAAEAMYEQMWAADVAAMVGYHGGASAAAAALPSWQQALRGLPGLGQVASAISGGAASMFAAPAAATAAVTPPALNTGLGNIGSWNLG
ncbi:hypothetical protein DSI90_11675, partial [Mycobacterium tuberculosis]